ncbi:hypothetical protein IGI04_025840 [Brassica rapa subsp. trilocularis]|uniref:Uncharacterized protein n=1 Tax=Brassica rapa subsp. trilocularis TaxID=1813537 RepID=A0ABQ7KY61_BRACM|nr:hypothetical protein IGI04_025840 [Brassica rapa subsp. trilocularis]
MKILNRTNRVEAHTCGLDVGERKEEEEENKQRKKDVVVVLSRETRETAVEVKRGQIALSPSQLARDAVLVSKLFSGARCKTKPTLMWVITSPIEIGMVIFRRVSGWTVVMQSMISWSLLGLEALLYSG